MKHWNGNLLCSVDIETTGLDPKTDDIVEIAVLPLKGDYSVRNDVIPFDMVIRPKNPSRFKSTQVLVNGMTLKDVMAHGTDPYEAAELLDKWFEKLGLPERKRIMPLGTNYTNFDKLFLEEFLGKMTYDHIFDYHVRDTMVVGMYINDLAATMREPLPFPRVGLDGMCSVLGIENPRRHRALGDAYATSLLYERLTYKLGQSLIDAHRFMNGQSPIQGELGS